ncbi:MAG TPA: hypothetical protein DEP05_02745 [Betaproteobacteria bacterium]|nr:hypothetical protein [Betaproteobacteria bacterium]
MSVNGFSVGRDISLDIVGPDGPLRFGLITSFTTKPDMVDHKVKGLDGITQHVRFYDGWSGSFEIERQGSMVDDYFAQLEADYYAGKSESNCTLTETITETSGAVSQYRYLGVLLKLDDAGAWKGDSTVKQKIAFMASRREKVA